ncbi:MAG: citramalate synthase [Magnetovibrio sp.]|nr:citramalate synthase [Magnetovibrio sp.]|tara:strand:+ start:35 stop:1624 length:1590 start_codon:yes stop_codon:yes gene_type:complete
MSDNRIYLYDCTLRDGAQTQGVDFSATDKTLIAKELDLLGIDYVEGGWPGANPTDDAFFASPPTLTRSCLTAFGMTRRAGRSSDNDPGLNALLDCGTRAICMVGKTWDFHVNMALEIKQEENIAMIADSIAHASTKVNEVMFDAEHFFDGYKDNPEFALACLKAAHDAGGRWIILCDTNGGTLPHEITEIVNEVTQQIPGSKLGIHCHDDTGNAVANTLAAVRAGVRQVQGALNGLGERCGNANLISIIPSLVLKMGYETGLSAKDLTHLTHVSKILDECLNRQPVRSAPYVGDSAFTHKGGLHVSAVGKDPRTYEHVEPNLVGNQRHIVISDQAGRANILARLREIGISVKPKDPKVTQLVKRVKEREFEGYTYDGAGASFELLARRALGKVPEYFRCNNFRVLDERRWDANGDLVIMSEATVKLTVDGDEYMTVAEGNGPVNALDMALRKVLTPIYPTLEDLRLVDFKVRILRSKEASAATTRVMIQSSSKEEKNWSTVGVSTNIIEASYEALRDSIIFKLYRDGIT